MPNWIYKKMSDEALMKAYARGRSGAFDCLYLRHKDKLFSFVRRQCGNHAIAEELAHDAWMAVIRQHGSYQPTAKFVTWLYRIAHNRLVDHWRKFGSSANVITEELTDQHSCKSSVTKDIQLTEIFDVLSELPASQLTTMLLKIEGFSRDEISEITSVKPETVKSRLRYAKDSLRELMEVKA